MRPLALLLMTTVLGGVSFPAFATKYHCHFLTEAGETPDCILETSDAKSRCEQKFDDVFVSCYGDEEDQPHKIRQIFCIFYKGQVGLNTLPTTKNGSLTLMPGIAAGGTATTDARFVDFGYQVAPNHNIQAACDQKGD